MVRAKNKLSGHVAELPESLLPYLPNWERVDGPAPDKPKPNLRLPKEPAPSTGAAPAASDEKE